MSENTEINISEYYHVSLTSLTLPDNYEKLIKRIRGLNGFNNYLGEKFIVETVGDIIELEPYQLSKCQGVGKLYVDTLIEFKKVLPFILNKLKQEPNSVFEEDIFTSLDNSYSLATPIDQLSFSPRYQKLIKRISAVIDNIETVQDIINIDVHVFSKLPAVGKLYVELLLNLQSVLSTTDTNNNEMTVKIELPNQEVLSKLYVNYSFLSKAEIKLLKKLKKYYGKNGDVCNVNMLLNLDKVDLAKQIGFGASFLILLSNLQNKIRNELGALPENITEHTIKQRGLFISGEIAFVGFNEIDNILIEDVEGYLWKLDEMEMDIGLSRWGFNQRNETLEEVGGRYGCTRERVRQLEKLINTNFHLSLRIQPKVLWANIREKMTENLTALLPNLAQCFVTDKLFYAFIELCCQVKKNSIGEIMFTTIDIKIINSIICNNPSPIAHEIVIGELMSSYGYSKAAATNGIKQLDENGKLETTEQGIYPKKLGRAQAVAHTLAFYPAGLPWKDIARIVNKKCYSSTKMDETRSTHGFNDSEYIYLCGKGTYRNLIFLDLEQFNVPEIMQHLFDYFKQKQVSALHLHDYFFQSKANRSEIEYFTLRHLVREYGENYGLYFNGKSGTDSVSLNSDVKLITQTDVIMKVLNESKVAMTKQEIAERLKSKSVCHAGFYINTLMEEGKVVRVDPMVYTTTEKAFVNMDTNAIMEVIKDIMSSSNIIVESDVFREYVNMELNLSYSKYIYASLVKIQIKELAWYRNGSLFSKESIPYKNLLEVCKQLYNPNISNNENIKILQQALWITDAVAIKAIYQWKRCSSESV